MSDFMSLFLAKMAEDNSPCWKGYKQIGEKTKGGKKVPNCVKATESTSKSAENKPREGKKPHMTSHNKKAARLSHKDIEAAAIRSLLGYQEDSPYEYVFQDDGSFVVYGDEDVSPRRKKKAEESSIANAPILCTPGFGCKRFFTPIEEEEVAAAKEKMFPSIFTTRADPIHTQMSSPEWAGVGTGMLGALLGGTAGYGFGSLVGGPAALTGVGGAAIGGGIGGLYGYINKLKKNKELEALITEMPVGADIGDVEMYSNPKIRQQLARDLQRQLIKKGIM